MTADPETFRKKGGSLLEKAFPNAADNVLNLIDSTLTSLRKN